MDTPPAEGNRNDLTVVPYSTGGWSVVLCSPQQPLDLPCRQNSLGNVVLYNRRNNQFQLSTNAQPLENGVDQTTSSAGICPTCHRALDEEGTHHSPGFMDSEYFRLLSSTASDAGNELHSTDGLQDDDTHERRSGSLPRSAFNQGYFEQYDISGKADSDSLWCRKSWEEGHVG
jgi:hypothetical protein